MSSDSYMPVHAYPGNSQNQPPGTNQSCAMQIYIYNCLRLRFASSHACMDPPRTPARGPRFVLFLCHPPEHASCRGRPQLQHRAADSEVRPLWLTPLIQCTLQRFLAKLHAQHCPRWSQTPERQSTTTQGRCASHQSQHSTCRFGCAALPRSQQQLTASSHPLGGPLPPTVPEAASGQRSASCCRSLLSLIHI